MPIFRYIKKTAPRAFFSVYIHSGLIRMYKQALSKAWNTVLMRIGRSAISQARAASSNIPANRMLPKNIAASYSVLYYNRQA